MQHWRQGMLAMLLLAQGAASAWAGEAGYPIHAGDVLHISVWKEPEMDRELLVLPDGTIDFPLVGSLAVAGQTTVAVQAALKQKLARMVPDAAITVAVKETRGNTVSLLGQVAHPGEIVMNRGLTVMQALSQVGGLTTYASGGRIVILRQVEGKETSIPFDYDDVARGRALESNILLQPGDVVVVPESSLF